MGVTHYGIRDTTQQRAAYATQASAAHDDEAGTDVLRRHHGFLIRRADPEVGLRNNPTCYPNFFSLLVEWPLGFFMLFFVLHRISVPLGMIVERYGPYVDQVKL